jgi:hypothetical protein
MTNELAALMNDSLTNKVALFNENASKYTDQAVRDAFFEILGEEKLTWKGWRRHKIECFEIMENVLDVNIPLSWVDSPFYKQFVETKSTADGDTNEFVVEDASVLFTSKLAGNYWSIDRQKVQGNRSFSVQVETIGIRVYDELERFLKGTITLEKMVANLQKAFQDEIDSRIYTSFNGIGTYLPAKFQETGSYDKDTLADLIQRVQVASRRNVILAGTRSALAHIVDGINANIMSEKQKEEIATTGMLLDYTGLGVHAMQIPQSFARFSYDFKVDNNSIFVLPDGVKPVKLFFEGDTRTKENNEKDNDDMTIDATVMMKTGVGIICPTLVGKYTIV